ncbi:hypothetical protein F4801DRAFT_529165 [Xylaria longipes]|nr:hypothetical protein F4801DRAFT_529165 [Xylaria longipes]RYC65083.1 hypothetical protein CHU98_g1084 [Xylaria longipes]
MSVNSQSQNNKSTEQLALDAELKSSSGTMISEAPSPVSIAFTPIHCQRPMDTEHGEPNIVPLGTSQKALNEVTHIGQKRAAECNKTSVEKRAKITTRGSYPTRTKQLTMTPAQTPTSFRSLRVTKPMGKIQGQSLTEKHDTTLFLACAGHTSGCQRGSQSQGSTTTTTIKQYTPQPTSIISRASSDIPDPEISRPADCNHSVRETPIDRFPGPIDTPCSQEVVFEGTAEYETTLTSAVVVGSSGWIEFCNNGDTSFQGTGAIHNTATGDHWSDSSDAYPLDGDIADDDIIQLLTDTPGSVEENHIPPSSVQGWDHESRSATEYDPNLKYSPPDLEETETNAAKLEPVLSNRQTEASEDLLDEDVDWNTVLVNMDTIQKDLSVNPHPNLEIPKRGNTGMCAKKPGDFDSHPNELWPVTAFVRPPFPQKVRDRPSVPGMSSDTLLRTCFRIGMMISQTTYCFNHMQDVVFELYARVTYSSRERLARKQHFQFVDLYKDQQPYPAATLANWRMDSQLDKDSSVFLDTSGGPRLCWCMCKPMKDSKAAVGWTYTVLNIREIDREQLHWAKRIICADYEEPSAETLAAKL